MRQGGFTMIGMIISLVILSVLGTTAGSALSGGVRAFSENADVLQTLGKLRYASERMAREVREIRRDPAMPDQFEITAMSASALSFTRGGGTVVTLTASPPLLTLSYTVPAGTWTLTDEVSSMNFQYFQKDGTSSATGNDDVAFIEFNLELTRAGRRYPQRTRVALRNRQ
jgi:type II secretory pathway pseudopilin PulG